EEVVIAVLLIAQRKDKEIKRMQLLEQRRAGGYIRLAAHSRARARRKFVQNSRLAQKICKLGRLAIEQFMRQLVEECSRGTRAACQQLPHIGRCTAADALPDELQDNGPAFCLVMQQGNLIASEAHAVILLEEICDF